MQRRRFLITICTAALAACGRRQAMAAIPAGKDVLAFGDSVTFGTDAGSGEDWPTLLAALTGWKVHNAGIAGDTAEAGKGRIGPLVRELQPALVIVEIGGNDFLRRRAARVVKEDLRQIVRTAKQGGAAVVLVAVPELSLLGALSRRPVDAPLYAELGEEEGVPVIADVFSGILARPELCADQIHPNARGYREMAAAFHERLKKLGLAA